jgi:hypothetical protein
MLVPFPRRLFSLDPLMAEAKRRARQRRALVALGVVLLAGSALGVSLALRSPGGGSPGATPSGVVSSGNYADGISLRYPSGWTRLQCRTFAWASRDLISLLTTARRVPTCKVHLHPGPIPPPENLGANGAAIFISAPHIGSSARLRWNARIGGQPANVPLQRTYRTKYLGDQVCPGTTHREYRYITIKLSNMSLMNVGALICGPHFANGEAAVRRVLASMRFAKALQ